MIRHTFIACGAAKLPREAAAKDLYVGSLFRLARRYAEASGDPWWILSAKHGLLHPDEQVAPYELFLSGCDPSYRAAWARLVAAQILSRVGTAALLRVTAPVAYTAFVAHVTNTVEKPLVGLRIGKQLAFFKNGATP
jgi:hypothetical protein